MKCMKDPLIGTTHKGIGTLKKGQCPRLYFKAPFPSQQFRFPSPFVALRPQLSHASHNPASVAWLTGLATTGADQSCLAHRHWECSRRAEPSQIRVFLSDILQGRHAGAIRLQRGQKRDWLQCNNWLCAPLCRGRHKRQREREREGRDASGMWAWKGNKCKIWIWYFAARIFIVDLVCKSEGG